MGHSQYRLYQTDLNSILILCMIMFSAFGCTDFSCAKTKTYTIDAWNQDDWRFAGFAIGPRSGDHYHLLSESASKNCAIIRETAIGSVLYSKFYHRKPCRGIVIDSNEQNCYFVNNEDSSLGVSKVNCSDGNMIIYKAKSTYKVDNDKFSLSISDTGNTIFMSGSIYNNTSGTPGDFNVCRYNTSASVIECSLRPSVGTYGASSDAVGVYTNSDDWVYMIAYDSTGGHFAIKLYSNLTYMWVTQIDCTAPNPSNCLPSTNGYSDSDGTNIHSAYTLQDSPKYTLYFVLDIDTGNNVTAVQRTTSDQDVEISSLYVDSNGVTWINLYTNSSSGYSELISYDINSGNSKTYKQDGIAYFYQFVNPNNDNYWYGIAFQSNITEAKLNNMDFFRALNVSTVSEGLIIANEIFNITTIFPSINSWETVADFREIEHNAAILDINISISIDVPDETQLHSTSKAVAVTSIVVASVTISVAALANLASSTSASGSSSSSGSKQSLWAIINLYQEILLIPMLGTYLGDDFQYYITEFELALFDFKFLKFIQIPVLEFGPSIIDELDYNQPDGLFADNEFESGSALYNCFQIIKAILIWLLLDLAFLIYCCIINKAKPERQFWYKINNWFADFFHFTVYLRLLIESCTYIFISCMLEISQFDNAKDYTFSYIIALMIFISTFAFILIPVHYFKYRQEGVIKTRYFSEIYDDFKDTPASKLYMFMFILRRFLTAIVIVFMNSLNIWVRCSFFTLIQIIFLIFILIIRPFEKSKDNLIEIINEVTFTVLCITVTICNSESRWFKSLDTIIIFFLMVVGILICLIVNIDLMIGCVKKYREKGKQRAEQYLEDNGDDECMDDARRSSEVQEIHQESELDQPHSNNHSQNMSKSIKQAGYSNIQNESLHQDENNIENLRSTNHIQDSHSNRNEYDSDHDSIEL